MLGYTLPRQFAYAFGCRRDHKYTLSLFFFLFSWWQWSHDKRSHAAFLRHQTWWKACNLWCEAAFLIIRSLCCAPSLSSHLTSVFTSPNSTVWAAQLYQRGISRMCTFQTWAIVAAFPLPTSSYSPRHVEPSFFHNSVGACTLILRCSFAAGICRQVRTALVALLIPSGHAVHFLC